MEKLLVQIAVEYILRLKKEKNVKSTELSELTNIPKSTLDKFLAGNTDNPSYANICSIVRVLGGSMDEMLGMQPVQKVEQKPIDVDMLIAVQEKERDGWQQLHASQRDQIEQQSAQIARYAAHIKRQSWIVAGSNAVTVLALVVILCLLLVR